MSFNTINLKWIAWDLDGTLADTKDPDYKLEDAPVIKKNVKILKEQVKAGYKVFIFTARHWDDVIIIEKWLKKHRIPFKGIWCGKPLVKEVWDDKVFNPFCKECYERSKKQNTGRT